MDVTKTTAATAATSAATSAANVKKAASDEAITGVAGDFETFLTLLTTQMRNQDPLKPMESTEFVAQLASFSAVEQQIRANDRLDGILSALAGGDSAGLAEWIGKEVRAPAKAAFSGEEIEVGAAPIEGAESAVLVVRNDFEKVVARKTVDPQATTVTWDGTDDYGTKVAHGNYSFELESFAGKEMIGQRPGTVYTTVEEVRIVDGTPALVLADGSQVSLDEITALR